MTLTTVIEELQKISDNMAARAAKIYKFCDYKCDDCGEPVYGYMLKDDIWKIAVPDYEKILTLQKHFYLCFSCIKHRLGRQLKVTDFTDAPINAPIIEGVLAGLRYARWLKKAYAEKKT